MSTIELETRTMGKSGIEVSSIGFGLWAAGGTTWGPTDDNESLRAIDRALDEGVNFFDTADVYGDGHSEELLGKAMRGRRHRFVVGTKLGWQGFDDEKQSTAYTTVDRLISGVESNLVRLQTDYIDIIQSHINFQDPTMEVFLDGFQRLQREGKVRAYGLSTSNFDYIRAFTHDGQCSTLQIDYSILNRTAEAEILPYCLDNDIGVIIRGALAMGILTGKFGLDSQFPEGDFRRQWLDLAEEKETFARDLEKVDQLRPLANRRTLAQLALQFALVHPAVTTVIPGVKNTKQLMDNLGAAIHPPLSDSEQDLIGGITPAGGGRKIWPA